jgi:cysteine synthase
MGCRGVAVLPAGMSKERFDWLDAWVSDPSDIIRTVGTESNVKEIYDACNELERQPDTVILNQFSEFGNYLGHVTMTGTALERVYEAYAAGHPEAQLRAFVSATGSAGTIGAGDWLKHRYGTKIVAVEALECPTMLENGFGEHNIQGIGDKHIPLIHNVMNTDVVVGISDRATDGLDVVFNTEVGQRYLAARKGLSPELIEALTHFGFSSICNTLAAIKTSKHLGQWGPRRRDHDGRHGRGRLYPSERIKTLLTVTGTVQLLRRSRRGRRPSWRNTSTALSTDSVLELQRGGPSSYLQPRLLHLGRAARCAYGRLRSPPLTTFLARPGRVAARTGRTHRRNGCRGCAHMLMASRLVCQGCGHVAQGLEFVCAHHGDGRDHVLMRELDESALEYGLEGDTTYAERPFLRWRHRLHAYHLALSLGWSDTDFIGLVSRLEDAVARLDRRFVVTPLLRADDIAALLAREAPLWVKDETRHVAGSHKARHLFPVLLALEVTSGAKSTPLAIASCGNAALAAAVLARAAERP